MTSFDTEYELSMPRSSTSFSMNQSYLNGQNVKMNLSAYDESFFLSEDVRATVEDIDNLVECYDKQIADIKCELNEANQYIKTLKFFKAVFFIAFIYIFFDVYNLLECYYDNFKYRINYYI